MSCFDILRIIITSFLCLLHFLNNFTKCANKNKDVNKLTNKETRINKCFTLTSCGGDADVCILGNLLKPKHQQTENTEIRTRACTHTRTHTRTHSACSPAVPSAAALQHTEKILGGGGGFYVERTLEKQHVAAAAELFMTRVETEGSRGCSGLESSESLTDFSVCGTDKTNNTGSVCRRVFEIWTAPG